MTNSKAIEDSKPQLNGANHLIAGCLQSLDQCDQLLQLISQEVYVDTVQASSSVGAHIRHILDRYHCLFAGLTAGCVDYDARKRDRSIENSLEVASFAVTTVRRRIQDLGFNGSLSDTITVRETVHSRGPSVSNPSSVGRELMGLVTHSIHHLAIIALLVKEFDYKLDADFGKAASTIVYERS